MQGVGKQGLAASLADLRIEGLVDENESQCYGLTKEGREQALREGWRAPSLALECHGKMP